MDAKFKKLVNSLEKKYLILINSEPSEVQNTPKKSGVYLFSKGKKHLYAGRTNNFMRRLNEHTSDSVLEAPFALRMAREATGKIKATYKKKGSQKDLLSQKRFRDEVKKAKSEIRKMQFRYVVESDSLKQTLLEIYVAVASKAKYNDFNTH